MRTDFTAKRTAFRVLHDESFFVIPNPWNLDGVQCLETLGFNVLPSTGVGSA
jgi:2-methylisocitrate lyase-like PEP mutase family enzyme